MISGNPAEKAFAFLAPFCGNKTMIKRTSPFRFAVIAWRVWFFALSLSVVSFGQDKTKAKVEPGLAVMFDSPGGDKATDVAILPNVALYIVAGQAPTPFLPGGKFSAEWNGYIVVDMRDNYTFQAELNGSLKLEINSAPVLETSAKGTNTEPSKPVRLNKGTNVFKVHFSSPADGDAFVRLAWSSREFPPEPITQSALAHEVTPESQRTDQLRLGRELFAEFRCAKCHVVPTTGSAIPELAMDAPSFDGIGSRRNYDWMARWVLDPSALRPAAHMPKLLPGAKAGEDAEAIAAFLAQQKFAVRKGADPSADHIEPGRKLFETLHCVACHNAPDSTDVDPKRIGLKQVREKFAPGSLVAFLQKPEEHYAWIRMPNFKFTADEGAQLAAFLQSAAEKPKETTAPTETAFIERGKKLVQTSGCLNCHSLKLPNQFKAPSLAELGANKWEQGCLAEKRAGGSKAPQFSFSAAEREALRAFGATDRASLARHVPMEFVDRQSRLLNCRECHGKMDGFPPLETLGGKLKPEWTKAFIAGEVSYKPRPWIESRMPHFAQRAEGLAAGLAAQHGYSPRTASEPPIDQEAAKIGRKLVSANGGFFCVSCHAAGSFAAQQVFESNGVNLAYTGERILKPYYHRWLRNPLRIDPITKMPVYFDNEGKSPLADIYEGDGTKQIEAIWQYIRLGNKMPSPAEVQ
jgi:mono/diheme cytochrome c family protein